MNKKSIFLIIGIAVLTIGFAAVSTVLYINGTATISNDNSGFVNGVIFDSSSLTGTNIGTPTLSESGRTINFTVDEMSQIGDEATLKFKVRNNSQYNAKIGTPAISCYDVTSYSDDAASSTGTANGYLTYTADTTLSGVTVNAGGNVTSSFGTVTIKMVKSYSGDTPKTIKFQCVLNVSAEESTTAAAGGIEMVSAMAEVGQGAYGVFRSEADLSTLDHVEIDGATINPTNYETASGSTIVRLKPEYTSTLALGNHSIKIVSEDGAASANFEIDNAVTFTIDRVGTFKATEGMTWSDWIDSYGISAGDNGIVWIAYKGMNYISDSEVGCIVADVGNGLGSNKVYKDSQLVFYEDVIQPTTYDLGGKE